MLVLLLAPAVEPTSPCASLSGELDFAKLRAFNLMLAAPARSDVQERWWVQHTPLQRIGFCMPTFFGPKERCNPNEDALIRCGTVPDGANQASLPNRSGAWPICLNMMDVRSAQASTVRRCAEMPCGNGAALSEFSARQEQKHRDFVPDAAAPWDRPLFYSFGIANDWFPDDFLGRHGFEVHSFDPTAATRSVHLAHQSPGVTFHHLGLQSSLASCRNSQRGTTKYGLLSGELHSLTNLRNTLNHTHRRINIMKIDCEGCEWDAFWEMSRFDTHALDDVEMLLIEVHPVRERMLRTDADLRKFVAVWEYLLEQQGFRFFFHRPNAGARHPTWTLHKHMSATGALRKVCCFELGLVKPHSVKRHLAYFNRDGLHQSLYHDLLRESYPWPSGRRPITAG